MIDFLLYVLVTINWVVTAFLLGAAITLKKVIEQFDERLKELEEKKK